MKKAIIKKKIKTKAVVILISIIFIGSTMTLTAISTDQTPDSTPDLLRTVAINKQNENPKPLPSDEIRFDDGTTTFVICDPTAGHTWEGAIRATPEETAPYDGWALTTVGFFHSYGTGEQFEEHDGKVKIYDQGTQSQPGPLLNNPDDDAFHVDVQDWFEIELTQPITIDGNKDIWISIETTTGPLKTHYFGTDNAPTVLMKGDWFKYQGQWQQLHSLIQDDCNWNLYGIVEEVGALSCDAGGPYEGNVGEDIQFTGSATGGTPPYSWHWDFGDGNTSDEQNPIHSYSAEDVYTVVLTVVDSEGETATDDTTATITEQGDEPELEIVEITNALLILGVKATVKNNGSAPATDVNLSITVEGGFIILNGDGSGTISSLSVDGTAEIKLFPLGIGLGIITDMPTIKVTADCSETDPIEDSVEAKIIGPLVLFQ